MNAPQLALPPTQGKYRALLDADVLLELFYNRLPFVKEVERLLGVLRDKASIHLYITDRTLRRIAAEHTDLEHAFKVAEYFRQCFVENTVIVSDFILSKARELAFPDFESAVEHACAEEHDFDAIITQNPSNYPGTLIPIWSVSDLEGRIALETNLFISQFTTLLPEQLSVDDKTDDTEVIRPSIERPFTAEEVVSQVPITISTDVLINTQTEFLFQATSSIKLSLSSEEDSSSSSHSAAPTQKVQKRNNVLITTNLILVLLPLAASMLANNMNNKSS